MDVKLSNFQRKVIILQSSLSIIIHLRSRTVVITDLLKIRDSNITSAEFQRVAPGLCKAEINLLLASKLLFNYLTTLSHNTWTSEQGYCEEYP